MTFHPKRSNKTLMVVTTILLISVILSSCPVFSARAQVLYQYPTVSVFPSNVVMYTPVTTVTVTVSAVKGLNVIQFIFSFNSQFLSVSTSDIALGNLFSSPTAQLYTNIYYLNSTGLSYINAIVEMPGNTSVSSSTTENVLSIKLHLLPTATAGLQSGLTLTSAQAYFTDGQFVDQSTGMTIQSSTLTVGYLTTTMTATSLTDTAGNPVTLTSTLQDSQGNPLSGFTISYYIGSQSVGNAITDASGISSVSYTPSTAGTYTINTVFVGNQTGGTFASSNGTATLTVNPQSLPPTSKTTGITLKVPSTATTGVAATFQGPPALPGTSGAKSVSSRNV